MNAATRRRLDHRSRKGDQPDQDGFSLLEVIVALAVSAILASSLLTIQNQSAHYMEMGRDSLASLNAAQDILARRYPDQLQTTPEWITWSGKAQGEWRLQQSFDAGEKNTVSYALDVKVKDYTLRLHWFAPDKPW